MEENDDNDDDTARVNSMYHLASSFALVPALIYVLFVPATCDAR